MWTCSKLFAGCHVPNTKLEADWSGYARRRRGDEDGKLEEEAPRPDTVGTAPSPCVLAGAAAAGSSAPVVVSVSVGDRASVPASAGGAPTATADDSREEDPKTPEQAGGPSRRALKAMRACLSKYSSANEKRRLAAPPTATSAEEKRLKSTSGKTCTTTYAPSSSVPASTVLS
uniref:Uncharacterized protein n=1 Tax=Pyramimonas obovata TaxID=1411642 RepID=A0A7S0RP49_9CHLO|mmetsp:Transcript_39401/g.85749  ORF Transcript_39401/g.85749 Transcript_39401/m.85749 type:complete len:173 (+) Transcript_39401:247-765(+)